MVTQVLVQLITGDGELRLYQNRKVRVISMRLANRLEQVEAGQRHQAVTVQPFSRPTHLCNAFEVVQLSKTHRGIELGHLAINAHSIDCYFIDKPEVSQ